MGTSYIEYVACMASRSPYHAYLIRTSYDLKDKVSFSYHASFAVCKTCCRIFREKAGKPHAGGINTNDKLDNGESKTEGSATGSLVSSEVLDCKITTANKPQLTDSFSTFSGVNLCLATMVIVYIVLWIKFVASWATIESRDQLVTLSMFIT